MTGAAPFAGRASTPSRGDFARGVFASWLAVPAAGVARAGAGSHARLRGGVETRPAPCAGSCPGARTGTTPF